MLDSVTSAVTGLPTKVWEKIGLFTSESAMKRYVKPAFVKLGDIRLIRSNSTGPSSDGKKYAGFFK